MANGIPVRLSADLTVRARAAASTLDRSLTEQVEHWARLGQVVEDVILSGTVARLKARSHDPDLQARLDRATTPEGRAKAIELIKSRSAVRYGATANGAIRAVKATAKSKKTTTRRR